MTRVNTIMVMAGAIFCLMASSAWGATDYANKTTDELSRLRGTLRNASQEERIAFRNEWRSRVQMMSQEEFQRYIPQRSISGGRAQSGRGFGGGRGQGAGGCRNL